MKKQFQLGDAIDTSKIRQTESERKHVWDIERGDKNVGMFRVWCSGIGL